MAAAAITIFSLILIFGPVTWLGVSLGDNLRTLYARLADGSLTIPPPYESVQTWPFVGGEIYQIWYLASTNIKALLGEWAEQLKVIGSSVLAIAGDCRLGSGQVHHRHFRFGISVRARAGAGAVRQERRAPYFDGPRRRVCRI